MLYNDYFEELIKAMKEQGHFTKVRYEEGRNFCVFLSDFPSIEYLAVFRGRGETRKVCTELRIAKKTGVFNAFKERESEINAKLDVPLCWDPSPRTNLIRLQRNGAITVDTVDANELADIKTWHIKTLREFKKVFTPEIRCALER